MTKAKYDLIKRYVHTLTEDEMRNVLINIAPGLLESEVAYWGSSDGEAQTGLFCPRTDLPLKWDNETIEQARGFEYE